MNLDLPVGAVEQVSHADMNSGVVLQSDTFNSTTYELKEKVAALQAALLAAHPMLPVLLRDIHRQLKADPELVTVLEEDEIGTIVNGLKRQTQTELVTTAPKPVSAAAALKKQIKAAGANAVELF